MVVLLAIEIATAGLTATPLVDVAPVVAVVVIVSVDVALKVNAPAPVIDTLLARAASEVLVTMFRPSATPMPDRAAGGPIGRRRHGRDRRVAVVLGRQRHGAGAAGGDRHGGARRAGVLAVL